MEELFNFWSSSNELFLDFGDRINNRLINIVNGNVSGARAETEDGSTIDDVLLNVETGDEEARSE